MGEKIKTLAEGNLKDVNLEIELNKPDKPGGLHSVHFQSNEFRFDVDEVEYLKLATAVLAGRKKLLVLKGD